MVPERLAAEYVLPLLRRDRREEKGLVRYLAWLADRLDVTVVDASAPALFAALAGALPPGVRQVPPDREGRNGKARGVLSGVAIARHEFIIVADDDVRYGERSLRAAVALLESADFVRLQNVYTAYPWFARWDTARCLIGRAFGGDFGGTVAVRRSMLERTGGYSPDVLFENLELERTVALAGGRVVIARDILVPRLPPTFGHFAGQRVRQAYDDFAQPVRLGVELALLPVLAAVLAARAWRLLAGLALVAIGIAEAGRRAGATRTAVPVTSALWAPAWVAERAVAVWLAALHRVRGGVPYAGARLSAAATPLPELRRRLHSQEGG